MKTNLKDQPLKTAKPESQAPDQVRSISPVSIEQAIKNSDRKIYTVVITGGPCAGKTTALSSLRKKLSEEGFHVIELAETATSILNANIHPWESPAFQKAVFSIQKCWEDTMIDQAGYIENPKCILLCDRGLMDGKAYCSGNDFEKIAAEFSLDEKASSDATIRSFTWSARLMGQKSTILQIQTAREWKICRKPGSLKSGPGRRGAITQTGLSLTIQPVWRKKSNRPGRPLKPD